MPQISTFVEELRVRLRAIRRGRSLSQLEHNSGINRATFMTFLCPDSNPRYATLQAIEAFVDTEEVRLSQDAAHG